MPELPEVETIRKQLSKSIVGEVVDRTDVRLARSYSGSIQIAESKITEIVRVGKYLFIKFASGQGFEIHLKMTGRLVVDRDEYQDKKHTRVVLEFRSGRKLYFWDTRTFGYVRLEQNISESIEKLKKRLGPDPWEMRELDFYKICQRYNRPIKNLILDQSLLAGVGNIYANDGLWSAGVDPRNSAKSLTRKQTNKLLICLRNVMDRGLTTGGASDNSYVDALGQQGKYQEEFLTYRRVGKPCLKCKRKIVRIVVGGRGTFICENCQS